MKLYDRLLAVYPREFRERFAAGMHAAFTEDYARARSRGRLAGLAFLTTTILHALWFGFVERLPRAVTIRSFLSVDVRDAVRSLWATPIVTAVAVLSLALGIGANTALFSILNGLVIRQLPVREPQRLVMVRPVTDWTNPIWEQIRERQSDLFESAGAWSAQRFNLADSGRIDPVDGAYVSGGLFHTLGITTIAGRPLSPADDVRGAGTDGHAAVISYRFWQQRFAGAQDVIGRRLTVNRVPFTIVGVAPRGFQGPEVGQAMDLFLPLASEAAIRGRESALDGRSSWWLRMMARLRPNQSIAAADAALDAVRPAIREATMPPEYNAEYRAGYLTGKNEFSLVPAATGASRLRYADQLRATVVQERLVAMLAGFFGVLAMLLAALGLYGVTSYLVSRRRPEIAVRMALGASTAGVVRLVLRRVATLLVFGAAIGVGLSLWAAKFVGALLFGVDARDPITLAGAASVLVAVGLFAGWLPARKVSRLDPTTALRG